MPISTTSLARVDGATWIAMACTALGWFALNILVANFGGGWQALRRVWKGKRFVAR